VSRASRGFVREHRTDHRQRLLLFLFSTFPFFRIDFDLHRESAGLFSCEYSSLFQELSTGKGAWLATTKMPGLVSATGVLGFLADEEPDLKIFALETLNDDIDTVWTEVAGALSQM
jgi:hypothetical protein